MSPHRAAWAHTLPHPIPFAGSLRGLGTEPSDNRRERRYAAARGGSRRETTFDTPLPAIETP
jgi:hypothetical protein